MRRLAFAAQMPLAFSSLLMYCFMRFWFRVLIVLRNFVPRKKGLDWSFLEPATLQHPLAIPLLMVVGPRLNPHAAIANFGPIYIAESLRFEPCSTNSDVPVSQSVTVYRTPLMTTTCQVDADAMGHAICVRPGWYTIAMRVYHDASGGAIWLPAIEADGRRLVEPREIKVQTGFYEALADRSSAYYRALCFHVIWMLSFADFLPRRWIEGLLLPVGSHDTQFYYGSLKKGGALSVEVGDQGLLELEVYLTFYNTSSFPIAWQSLSGMPKCVVDACPSAAFYLIRARYRTGGVRPNANVVKVQVHAESIAGRL